MLLEIFLAILVIFIIWQVCIRVLKKMYHFPAPAFTGPFLDSDIRRAMQPSGKLIERSGIREGMKVLEVGCGSGAYTTFVAKKVGNEGKVFALDIQPEMLKQLENKLAKPGNEDIRNIEPVNASAYDIPFEDNSLDAAYMVTVLQEIPDRMKVLNDIKRVLKPGGILAVTEFLPDPDYSLKSTTISLGIEAGFVKDKASGGLWNYTVRFKKP